MSIIEETQAQTPEQEHVSEADRWVREVFAVDGIDKENAEARADWFCNKVLSLRDEEKRVKEQSEIRLARLNATIAALFRWVGGYVEADVQAMIRAKGGKSKYIDFSSGRIKFRAVPEKPEFGGDGKAAVKSFAESYSPAADAYKTKMVEQVSIDTKVLLAALHQYASENEGQYPPGIIVTGGNDKMYVDPPKA